MKSFDRKIQTVKAVLIALLRKQHNSRDGFTLLEAIIVVALLGILAAIAAPSWFAFLNIQRLNSARSEAVNVLSQAKSQAKQHRVAYETGFRQQGQQVQWAIYPVGSNPSVQDWKTMLDGVKLLEIETTFAKKTNNIYYLQFNHQGEVNGQLGRVTFASAAGGEAKRCVIVSNLLGTIREGENRPGQSGNPCN